jgi:peptide chain release factor subunit 1
MAENLSEFIKDLSNIFDTDSEDTYISIYLNKYDFELFLEKRIRACRSVLKGNELKNFNATIKNVEGIIKKILKNNLAIFASHKNDFLRYTTLPVKVNNILTVDSSPYIRPLARILDEWESFSLVLINSNYAKIFTISLGKVDETKKLSADIINKHKKGGCSQARFNRLRKGAINVFLSDVVELLEKRSDDKIIIAGPGTIKKQFIEKLTKNLKEKIVDVIDIGIEDEKELLKKSTYLILEKEKRDSIQAVQNLKDEILKDGLATYGIEDTLKAVKNGQVELLIIEKNYKQSGWICEKCQVVERGAKRVCPYCGNRTSIVDLIEEILEFAERTDAEIEFTDDKEISALGHVGAILRYK